ncbi:HTH-type transcriptional activator RhaS [compost metagenome]
MIDYHHHSEYEFHYIPRGSGKVILEGASYSLQEGMLYLTGPGVTHSQIADDAEAMDELCLHIDIVSLPPAQIIGGNSLWGDHWEIVEAEETMKQLNALPRFPAIDVQEAMKWFLVAYEAWQENRLGLYTIVKQAIIQILLRTVGAYTSVQPKIDLQSRDMSSHRYQLAIQFIEDNFRRALNLEIVAERVQISPRQLQRIFREQSGLTFSKYMEKVRLIHVQKELLQTDLTLDRIAQDNGFTTSNYLHYVFKKAYGLTPQQYREQGTQFY